MNNKDKKELKTNTHYKEEMIIPQNIPIILVSSNEFISYCATTMASILHNINKSYHISFYILSFDLTDKNKKKLEKLKQIASCDIFFPKLDDNLLERFDKIVIPAHVSKVCYLKIFIPDILPETNKAIFIDCDTICRSDISELYKINLGENYFGMVEGVGNEIVTKYLWGEAARDYFNSGVILINIQKLREDNYLMQIENRISKNIKKYQIADQDIINDSFRGKILRISTRWNFFHEYHFLRPQYRPSDENDYKSSLENPSIVHFVGKAKPWHQESRHPYKKEFKKYFKMTPYYNLIDELTQELKKIFYYKTIKDNVTTRKYFLGLYRTKQSDYYKEKRLFGIKFYTKEFLEQKLFDYINEQKQNLTDFMDYTSCILQAQTLHKETFAQYKNCFTGRDVVLVATGPSALKYKPIEDAIHIGVNGAVYLNNISLDFVFVQDNTINQPGNENLTKDVLNYSKNNCKKFIGVASPGIRKLNLEQEKKIFPIPVSYTNYENTATYLLMDKGNTNDMPYDISREPIANLYGTPFSAMQFILYTNPRRVYLVGCDCSSGYAYDINKKNYFNLSPQIESWKLIKKYAYFYFPDIEIISINPVGLKEIFKDEYTDSYFRRN